VNPEVEETRRDIHEAFGIPPGPSTSSLRERFFFFTLVTGPRRSLSLKLSDTRVYDGKSAEVTRGVAGTNLSAALEAALPDFEAKVTLKPSPLLYYSQA